jgi:rod shape-determining protein MreC
MTPEEVHRVANERLMQMMPQVLPAPDAMGPQMPAPATGMRTAASASREGNSGKLS